MTTFKCNKCGDEFDLLDKKCTCGGVYVLPKSKVEQRADNSQSDAIALFQVRRVLEDEPQLGEAELDHIMGKMYSVAQRHT